MLILEPSVALTFHILLMTDPTFLDLASVGLFQSSQSDVLVGPFDVPAAAGRTIGLLDTNKGAVAQAPLFPMSIIALFGHHVDVTGRARCLLQVGSGPITETERVDIVTIYILEC